MRKVLKRVARGDDTMKKTNARGQHVTDSALLKKGRKALMKASGMGNGTRSPLTQQLLDTIAYKDSYVSIPLRNGRTKATTIFNLKDKAKRNDVVLHFTVSQDEKNVFAWFTRKAETKGKAEIKPIKAVKGKKNGPKRLETPTVEAVSA